MAFTTVLKISFAAFLTMLSAIEGSNSTVSPSIDHVPQTESGTTYLATTDLAKVDISSEVTTEIAPPVVTDSTTELLTELGLTANTGTTGSGQLVNGTEAPTDGHTTWLEINSPRSDSSILITSSDISATFPDQHAGTEGTEVAVPLTQETDFPDMLDQTTAAADVSRRTTLFLFFHKINFPDPDLQLLEDNKTVATLEWSFENQTHVDQYSFSYNQTDSYPGGFKQFNSRLLNGATRSIELTGIFPGARYKLNLEAVSGTQTTTVRREWIPATEPPSNVNVVETTANTINLEWIFPPHTPPLLVKHFTVTYKAQNKPSKPAKIRVTNQTKIVIDDLLPGVSYKFEVVTVSIHDRRSYAQIVVEETGILPPTGIFISNFTSFSFTLQWNVPEANYDHILVTCSYCPHEEQTINMGVNRATFEGLISGREYNGTMVTVKGQTMSEPAAYSVLTLPIGPTNVYIRLLKETRLQLVWQSEVCRGCVIDFYATTLWISKTSSRVDLKNVHCVMGECRSAFDNLRPGQEYRAEVRAVRGSLQSSPSVVTKRIPPAKPGLITFRRITHNQIHMVWTPSVGVVDKYIIGLCEADQPSSVCKTYTVTSSVTDFKCLNLKPSTSYNITLIAMSASLRSRLRWIVKSTTSHFPQADDRPPSSNNEITPYTFSVTFDTTYFDNSNSDILYYTVLVAEAGAISHADLPTHGNLTDGLKTRTWALAIAQETIQRYQIADQYSYAKLTAESGKREAYASKTIIIGEEKCSREETKVYCNGPLKDNKIYVYQFRAFTATGYADTPFSRHVMLPEDNSGVVAGISVVLILLFVIVLILIGMIITRKFRGYGRYKPAHSMEHLPIRMITRNSTRRRNSRPVLLTDFCHDFQVMNAHCHYGFSQEYEAIIRVGRKLTSNAAVLAASVSKNRYTNILPFDRTRVMLSPIDDVDGSDYINANYIPGYVSPREYIACQGPLPGTVDDTWRMIWEQDVATIVMLTQLIEKATVKCDQYWPEDSMALLYGDIKILMINKEETDNWCIRDFTLEKNDTVKQVRQFHYLAWPDHGVPESSSTLLNFIRTVREQIPVSGTATVAHCSAGVGRTGTFICLDRLMRQMEEYNFVDILNIVCDMRSHRNYMVQTEQQYVFIHKCVLEILEEKGIAPKRLPSISSIDTLDMNSRLGSEASAIKHFSGNFEDVVLRRNSASSEDESSKRISLYSMGSPKKSLIEDDTPTRSHKKIIGNGSMKKHSNGLKTGVNGEIV